jgi:hypothetical protein
MADPDRRTGCQERNRVFGIVEEIDAVAAHGLGDGILVPGQDRSGRNGDFFYRCFCAVGSD